MEMKRTFLISLILCIFTMIFITSMYLSNPNRSFKRYAETKKIRKILTWTSFFKYDYFMGPSLMEMNCQDNSCKVTSNRSSSENFDAVLFHWMNLNVKDLPEKRPGQRIILLNYESPRKVGRFSDLANLTKLVDWTISYRLDSDIVSQYGKFVRRTDQDTTDYIRAINDLGEKRQAAWMVSACNAKSERRQLVDRLRQLGVSIDEYGRCPTGNHSMPINRTEAYGLLSKRYRFYLSFENALCKDYATEKVFQPLYHGMIPIVFGGANYSEFLPEHSYIDVLDYPTLEDLADHLKRVDGSKCELEHYHDWRKEYQVTLFESNNYFFCDLCAKLQNLEDAPKHRDLSKWWRKKDCFSPMFSNGSLKLLDMSEKRNELYSKD